MGETSKSRSDREPIAIVGMACRFPGADSPAAFWDLLLRGVDAVREVPPDRWDVDGYYDPDPAAAGKMSTRAGGFLERVDLFDAAFFGLAPREAARMDPQQRLLLEVAWEALENAGQSAGRLAGTEAGVFAGLSTNDYWWLQAPDITRFDGHAGLGGAHCVATGRLSHLLDLRGPNMAVDTACSSSLVAVHLACRSLRLGDCDLALAGGVNVMVSPLTTVFLSKWGVLAPDGRSKAFAASADGFGRGEGCGMLVLERLSDALAAGDPVLAVIRGSAVNHDGHAAALAAPNGHAQQAVIRTALAEAGLAPDQISMIEAHGTGTPVGDPIEVAALAEVIGPPRPDGARCALGSLKTNIGHLEAAAGVAGIIKAVLSLQHRAIPRHLHLAELNPDISLDGTRLFIPRETTPWPDATEPRRAGISAFGLSGTNAHVIVEEAPGPATPRPASAGPRSAYLLTVSARSEEAVRTLARAYASRLSEPGAESLAAEDVCHTASLRRSHHPYRVAVVGGGVEELARRLAAAADEPVGPPVYGASRKTAFVFSGQGSQWAGMGRQLLAQEPVFRESLERSDAILRLLGGWSLIDALAAGEEQSRLFATEVAQPAIVAVQAALLALYRAHGVEPDLVAGHSLGEISAAYAASVFGIEEALRVAFHRGRLMQRATGQGRMAAVGLSFEESTRAIAAHAGRLSVAAINGPRSTVLSGETAALREVLDTLERGGVFCRDLGLDYAFHTEQMEPLMGDLAAALGDLRPRPARVPIVSTVTGEVAAGEELDAAHWARTMREPVRFAAAVERLSAEGALVFLEVGPHPVLNTPIGDVLKQGGREARVVASLRRGPDESAAWLRSLGTLHGAGCEVDWRRLYGEGRCVALPTYPWQRKRHWIEVAAPAAGPAAAEAPETGIVAGYYDRVADLSTRDPETFLTFAPFGEPVPGFSWLLTFYEPERHPEDNARLKRAQEELRRVLFRGIDFASVRSVLDFGCGYGLDLLRLAGEHPHLRLDGFTLSAKQAAYATRQAAQRGVQDRVSVFHHDSAKDEFPRRYDLVFGFEVAHYVQDKHELLANVERHLNDGGFLVLADFVANTVSEISHEATASRFPTREQWADLLAAYKLSVAECVDASREVSHFLYDPHAEENLARLAQRVGNEGGLRQHLASYDGLGRLFRRKLATYALLTIQKDPYRTKERIAQANRERLAAPTPYADVLSRERTGATPDLARLVYDVEWRPLPAPPPIAEAGAPGRWIVLSDRTGVGERLAELLRERGETCVTPSGLDELQRAAEGGCRGVVHLRGLDATPPEATTAASLDADLGEGCGSLLDAIQALADAGAAGRPRLWVVTRGAQSVGAAAAVSVPQGALWGLGRTIATEQAALWGGLVDLDPAATVPDAAARVLAEVFGAGGEDQVAWRGGDRYAARLRRCREAFTDGPSPWKPDATYLVTGGLGALGRVVARRMVEQGARNVALVQRSQLPPREEWAHADPRSPLAGQIAAIRELEAAGARVEVFAGDVAIEADVARVLGAVRASLPPLRGIVHAAGILDDGILAHLSPDRLRQVAAPKVLGAWNLHHATLADELDFFVSFSSLAALLGSPGQGNYAAANAGLDALAQHRRHEGRPALSIAWGPWSDVGMAAEDGRRGERVASHGIGSVTPDEGVALLEGLLRQDRAHVAVVALDMPRLQESWPQAAQRPLLADLGAGVPAVAEAAGEPAPERAAASIRQALSNADAGDRRRLIEEYVAQEMRRVLQLGASDFDMRRPLDSLGIDSLMAVELRNRFESDLPVRVKVVNFLEGSSPADLAAKLLDQLPEGAAPDAAGEPPKADRVARALEQIGQMSDEAVAALLAEKKKAKQRLAP